MLLTLKIPFAEVPDALGPPRFRNLLSAFATSRTVSSVRGGGGRGAIELALLRSAQCGLVHKAS